MDSKNFHEAYKQVKFQADNSDCFSFASNKRLTLLLNFYGSVYMKENNDVTEFLLNEDLKEYAKIVDNKEPEGINNYADYILALLPNYQNDDKKNWKSSLDEFNINEHLSFLPCSNSINCKYSTEVSPECLNALQNAIKHKDEKKHSSILGASKSNNLNKPTAKNINVDFGIGKQSSATSSQQIFTKKFNSEEICNTKDEESEKPSGFNAFRTARAELDYQNTKKFAKGGGNISNDKNFNYGVVKKSLGTRKGGVFAKFQPPVRSKGGKDEMQGPVTNMEVDEISDERLKNIDPAMIELIKNEIMDCGAKITWDDIAGLHLAKSTIQEIVVWPMLRPDIFTGLRKPPRGILLFGPPGTGKTLIGKCIASASNSTFFSISASSLTSKWVGDGEKMVRTLFAVAKVHQPSVVFIDEIDSLLSQRSDTEHESSRRIKTEFLVQLDGAGTGDEERILIIGATNRPHELDEAARRRLVKRLYIPLPDESARKQIIRNLISTERHCLTEPEIDHIAKLTKGYSGADVKNLCQDASLGPIRSISPSLIQSINANDVRPLNFKDFESALCRIKSSVSESDLNIYMAWDKQYGCGSA